MVVVAGLAATSSQAQSCQCDLEPIRLPQALLPKNTNAMLTAGPCELRGALPTVPVYLETMTLVPEIRSSIIQAVKANKKLERQCSGRFRVHADEKHQNAEASGGPRGRMRFEITCHWGGGASNVQINPHVHLDLDVRLTGDKILFKVSDIDVTNLRANDRLKAAIVGLFGPGNSAIADKLQKEIERKVAGFGSQFYFYSQCRLPRLPLDDLDERVNDGRLTQLQPREVGLFDRDIQFGLRLRYILNRRPSGVAPSSDEPRFGCHTAQALWAVVRDLQEQQKLLGTHGIERVVARGETLWSIAKQYYGDGQYYHYIESRNPQLAGRALRAGEHLRLTPVWAISNANDQWLVRTGESLWSIAQGSDIPFADLLISNSVRPGTPDLLYPRQILRVPPSSRARCPSD